MERLQDLFIGIAGNNVCELDIIDLANGHIFFSWLPSLPSWQQINY